jgi:phage-related baseplate assembly protein
VDIEVTLFLKEGTDKGEARGKADKAIKDYLGTLGIGDDVVISQVVKAALNVEGVRDVRNVTVNGLKDNIDIKQDERGECRSLEVYLEE